jgi:hypothetical protein
MANGFRSFSTSLFGRDPGSDAEGNAIPETVTGIKNFVFKQRQDAEALARDVKKLVGMGLSKDLLTQLQTSGASGLAQIRALASAGTPRDIAWINNQNKLTAAADVRAGMTTANALLGDDIARAKRDADAAKAIEAAVERAIGKGLNNAKLHAEVRGDQLVFIIRQEQKKKGKGDPFK